MGSRKQSAKARQVAAFKSQLGGDGGAGGFGMDDLFAREDARRERAAEERDEALRWKACESKNRYVSRAEAEAAIFSCEEHGRRGLTCYKCSYCNGWHLTSHGRAGA